MCKILVEQVWNSSSDRSFYEKITECSEILSAWGQEITGSFKKRINSSKMILKRLKGRRDENSIKVAQDEKKIDGSLCSTGSVLETKIKAAVVKRG